MNNVISVYHNCMALYFADELATNSEGAKTLHDMCERLDAQQFGIFLVEQSPSRILPYTL